jgi:hypothetical protein
MGTLPGGNEQAAFHFGTTSAISETVNTSLLLYRTRIAYPAIEKPVSWLVNRLA